MKKLLSGILCALLLCGCGPESSKKDGVLTIGIIQHTTHPALDNATEGFKQYWKDKDVKVEFIEKNAQGDIGTNDLIAKQFVADDVDLIYAVATPSAIAAVNASTLTNTPVVFNAVTDPVAKAAKLVKSMKKPGKNITGVSDAAPIEQQLQLIKDVLPNCKVIGMLYNIGEANGKIQVDQVKKLAPKLGMKVKVVGISQPSEVASAAQKIASECDCIYNITDNMIANATPSIVDKANQANIPVFGAEEGPMKDGLFASDSISYLKLGNQAADLAYQILVNDKDPGTLSVQTAQETQLFINQKQLELLKISIPDEIKERATFIK